MPSLMPGMAGAKEVYGIAVVGDDLSLAVPPKAMEKYGMADGDPVLIAAVRREAGAFSVMHKHRAEQSVFGKIVRGIKQPDTVFRFGGKAYMLTTIRDGRIRLVPDMAGACRVVTKDRLLAIKGSNTGVSYAHAAAWEQRLKDRGFIEALQNMKKLEIFQ